MNNKKLLAGAVATAMALPGLSLAAFDDQGMEYISAGEGLSGTMRYNIYSDSNTDAVDGNATSDNVNESSSATINSLRIFYTGHLDLGGGLRSTYYWELRVEDDEGADVYTEAYDLGIEGAFGKFEMGKINSTAERLVPGGSLDAALGSNDSSPIGDPHANGLRYESNSINGFEFGGSVQWADLAGQDDAIDAWAIAAKYTLPIGLEAGIAYESSTCHNPAELPTDTSAEIAAVEALGSSAGCSTDDTEFYDDADGWRFGARYGQDNYLVAYEYRSYDNFAGFGTNQRVRGGDNVEDNDRGTVASRYSKLAEYQDHRFAVQVKVDRVTLSANYSIEEADIAAHETLGGVEDAASQDAVNFDVPARKYDQTALGVDAAYALGARSSIIVGYKTVTTEQRGRAAAATNDATGAAQAVLADPTIDVDSSEWLLRYRVDF